MPYIKPSNNTKRKYAKRTKSHTDFYNGKPWKRLRTQYMREHVLDEYDEALGKTSIGIILHHCKPRADYPELELDSSNLILVSESSHGLMHTKLRQGLYWNKRTNTFESL